MTMSVEYFVNQKKEKLLFRIWLTYLFCPCVSMFGSRFISVYYF